MWFCYNYLSQNGYKTECIILNSAQRSHNFKSVSEIHVVDAPVSHSSTVKTFEVTPDLHLTFNPYIHALIKTCYYHLKSFQHTCTFIDLRTAKTIPFSNINSRLDYTNSRLYGMCKSNIPQLQYVHCATACIVLQSQFTSNMVALNIPHWLPIHLRNLNIV